MGSKKVHTHPKTDELHVFYVPADSHELMRVRVIKNDWRAMGQLVEGYIEVIHPAKMPRLSCDCMVTMVANEDGVIQNLPRNLRASAALPEMSSSIRGDVFFIGEGLVETREGGERVREVDFLSLPPEFHFWEGPGHPFPKPANPWSIDKGNKS